MKVKMYTTANCAFCESARTLLYARNILDIETIVLSKDTPWDILEFKKECPKATTVPQIFINDEHIGGYTELLAWLPEASNIDEIL